jgi:deaminated glutathione amidase
MASLSQVPFAVAGIQMQVRADQENVTEMGLQLNALMERFPWVQMVLFSELCAFGPSPANAQTLPGPAEEKFCSMAAEHHVWLIPGSLFEQAHENVYNTAPVIDPTGRIVTRYRKLFPFQPYENGISAGVDFAIFDVPGVGRFGLSICYDMWFPETTRTLVAMGAEIILHPTMTDTLDRDVELSIARASAATNQCYFFDINGIGHGGTGRSVVVGPSGDLLYQAGAGPETIPIEVDLARVRRERENGLLNLGQPLKSFRDRQVDFAIYRKTEIEYLRSLGPLQKPGRS